MKVKVVYESDTRGNFPATSTIEEIKQILARIRLDKPVKITIEYESEG